VQKFRLFVVIAFLAANASAADKTDPLAWPPITRDAKPWTRWWWMGSAVNKDELTRELQTFQKAGLGGVEVTPIYGAKGYEKQFIDYLSPKWIEMLQHTVSTAQSLGIGVDMPTGTGWCFGGPNVSDNDANATAVYKDGTVSQKPSGVKVKRPAPGGEGWMLNLLYPDAMNRYAERFDKAFAQAGGVKLNSMFHDSYEYKSDWAPDFFQQFEKRRGYKLESELPALFENKGDADHVARVKSDYRETVSDLVEESIARWTKWSHDHGWTTRNQAHGSPGNWLDVYAASDIPETEMFYKDRDILISKFASSAAHVTGKNLVGAETGTWVAEHFTETLADLKYLCDDMFLSGANRITWHGTAYSSADVPWPGWCFYASTEMNPRNSIWRDVPALNAYIARVQSVLQSGRPDNDILLYWPIHDFWHNDKGMVQQFTIHGRDWFYEQPIGKLAKKLWERGYTFDYVSDELLQKARVTNDGLDVSGNKYRVIVVPACEHMPVETLQKLVTLANAGATVIFENHLPGDVPGAADLEKRRDNFQELLKQNKRACVGEVEDLLKQSAIVREPMVDHVGLHFIRRAIDGGLVYFIANRGDQPINENVVFAVGFRSAVVMDPTSGKSGAAALYSSKENTGTAGVFVELEPGQSIIVHVLSEFRPAKQQNRKYQPTAISTKIQGNWNVRFVEGGPKLPPPFSTDKLASWTELGGEEAQRFAGTALYTITFDAPGGKAGDYAIDLGKVCQSARVRLNGSDDLCTLIIPPFRVPRVHLKDANNHLEVEVTNTSANRIRDLDRRKVPWKNFYDTNVVNLNYKPFDASDWPLADSGLLGPVTLVPQ